MEPVKFCRYRLSGSIGDRLRANENEWIAQAPADNPGMLGMLASRDHTPEQSLVPWAGEFIGKYLLSAIQSLRFSASSQLRLHVADLVSRTIACQAEDGYLGPFNKSVRLKANWDLWGHYHLLLALLLWHDETDNPDALTAAERIGGLICDTFLDSGLRVRETGSAEMNMAVIHGLGLLYLRTSTPRYLAMMREIEQDWEAAGNYLRTGIEAVPFYSTRHPRWESLHDLQGLAVLYRITGDHRYLQAFQSHWRSIMRWDVHNTGAFSTGEGAIGDPYTPGVIETCCTVAWMALSIDYLALTGDSRAADALETALYNAAAGAQHPSGKWWTYDTPMEGRRVPSYSALAFQATPDTPGLNCCSVNGPRALTMLSDWAVMQSGAGLAINYFGPGVFDGTLQNGTQIHIECKSNYPVDNRVDLSIQLDRKAHFPLLLRIPAWSKKTTVQVNGASGGRRIRPGQYFTIQREWSADDAISVGFDMSLRAEPGDGAALGKASVYRGPLLLAFDHALNTGEHAQTPSVSARSLTGAEIIESVCQKTDTPCPSPWITVSVPTANGASMLLSDFANAGRSGSHYETWLPSQGLPLPQPSLRAPDDGAMVTHENIVLTWSAPPPDVHEVEYNVIVSETADLSAPIINRRCINGTTYRITGTELRKLKPGGLYFWHVRIENRRGPVHEIPFPARFRVAP